MAIIKKYLKTKPVCKVTFKISADDADGAKKANIAGDFNNWSVKKDKMKILKDGSFSITLDLDKDNEYAFRYVLDGKNWLNENDADKTVPSEFPDANNSVVTT